MAAAEPTELGEINLEIKNEHMWEGRLTWCCERTQAKACREIFMLTGLLPEHHINTYSRLNHIFSSSFPAGENCSLYHFYGISLEWLSHYQSIFMCLSEATTDPKDQMLLELGSRLRVMGDGNTYKISGNKLQRCFHGSDADDLSLCVDCKRSCYWRINITSCSSAQTRPQKHFCTQAWINSCSQSDKANVQPAQWIPSSTKSPQWCSNTLICVMPWAFTDG